MVRLLAALALAALLAGCCQLYTGKGAHCYTHEECEAAAAQAPPDDRPLPPAPNGGRP